MTKRKASSTMKIPFANRTLDAGPNGRHGMVNVGKSDDSKEALALQATCMLSTLQMLLALAAFIAKT